jgi:hypothetical protein
LRPLTGVDKNKAVDGGTSGPTTINKSQGGRGRH